MNQMELPVFLPDNAPSSTSRRKTNISNIYGQRDLKKRKITKNVGIFKIIAHTLKRKVAEKQIENKAHLELSNKFRSLGLAV